MVRVPSSNRKDPSFNRSSEGGKSGADRVVVARTNSTSREVLGSHR